MTNEDNLTDLLPCPFCGGDGELKKDQTKGMPGSIVPYAFVRCTNCKASGPRKDDWGNPGYIEQAIAAWNARAR